MQKTWVNTRVRVCEVPRANRCELCVTGFHGLENIRGKVGGDLTNEENALETMFEALNRGETQRKGRFLIAV